MFYTYKSSCHTPIHVYVSLVVIKIYFPWICIYVCMWYVHVLMCVHIYMCMLLFIGERLCMCACLWRLRLISSILWFLCTLFIEAESISWPHSLCLWLVWLVIRCPEIPVFAVCLPNTAISGKPSYLSGIYIGSGDPNPGPHFLLSKLFKH